MNIKCGQIWADNQGGHLLVVYVPVDDPDTVWVCLSDQVGMPLDASAPISTTHFTAWTLAGLAGPAA